MADSGGLRFDPNVLSSHPNVFFLGISSERVGLVSAVGLEPEELGVRNFQKYFQGNNVGSGYVPRVNGLAVLKSASLVDQRPLIDRNTVDQYELFNLVTTD